MFHTTDETCHYYVWRDTHQRYLKLIHLINTFRKLENVESTKAWVFADLRVSPKKNKKKQNYFRFAFKVCLHGVFLIIHHNAQSLACFTFLFLTLSMSTLLTFFFSIMLYKVTGKTNTHFLFFHTTAAELRVEKPCH